MSPGGRPVLRDQHLQGVDAAAATATQNTLNYALGNLGGRQKAWMSAGAATPPAHGSIHPGVTRRPSRAQPRPQPSQHLSPNSTSPQLANILAHPAMNRPLPSPSAVFPSPAPSEEAERINTAPTLPFYSLSTTDGAHASLDAMVTEERRQGTKRPANPDNTEANNRQPPAVRTTLEPPSSARNTNPTAGHSAFSPTHGPLQHHQGQLPYQSPYPHQPDLDMMFYQQFPQLMSGSTMPQAPASYGMPHASSYAQPTPTAPANAYPLYTQPMPPVPSNAYASSLNYQLAPQNTHGLSRQPEPAPALQGQQPFQQMHHPQSHQTYVLDTTPSDARARGAAQARPRGRPRIYPNPSRPHPPPQQQVPSQPRQSDQTRGRLLPRPGFREPQQRQPNPARFSLHQAHLRSPVLQARSPGRLYQYVKGFLKPPVRIQEASRTIIKWVFPMGPQDLERIPKNITNSPADLPTRLVDEHSRLLRIRCAKWPTSWKAPTEHTWAIAETSWIPFSYFTFNGKNLEQRKKLHHGKDMPIDISPYVKEGDNVLEIAIMRQPDDDRFLEYLVAVEILAFRSHATIVRQCKEQRYIGAKETLERIKQRLAPAENDDDLSIVESNLTIQLFDPFSASSICAIPVRGKACLHFDCFDLETFLNSRQLKGGATLADQWKCPICNSDARPDTLVVDGFLDQVREKLAQLGLADTTRAIIMSQDGSWQPKVEARDPNGVQDRDTPDDDVAPARPPQRHPSAHAEVIDLSD